VRPVRLIFLGGIGGYSGLLKTGGGGAGWGGEGGEGEWEGFGVWGGGRRGKVGGFREGAEGEEVGKRGVCVRGG